MCIGRSKLFLTFRTMRLFHTILVVLFLVAILSVDIGEAKKKKKKGKEEKEGKNKEGKNKKYEGDEAWKNKDVRDFK